MSHDVLTVVFNPGENNRRDGRLKVLAVGVAPQIHVPSSIRTLSKCLNSSASIVATVSQIK